MPTQYFDDGSSFTYNADYSAMSSTDAPAYPTNVGGNFGPQRVNPNAENWGDVFKFGLSRYIDARFAAPVTPANAAPAFQRPLVIGGAQPLTLNALMPWLLIGGVAFLALK